MLLGSVGKVTDLVDWVSAVEGARLLWAREGEARFRVPRDIDPLALLAAAARLGEIGSFRFEPPRLSDLFLEAVER